MGSNFISMILSIAGVFGTILLIGILSIALGQIIWKRIEMEANTHFAFTFAAWFFLGLTGFIVLFSSLQIIFGARIGLLFTLIVGVVLAASYFPWREIFKERRRFLYGVGVWTGAFFVLDVLHAIVPLPRFVLDPMLAPFAYGFGAVVHSFRAENIALAIVSGNGFPLLNQNFAQSILSAAPHLLGFNMPQLSLLFWHTLVLAMAGVFVWGCARTFLTTRLAIIPTALVLAGNTAVSYRYISVTDTSHAILTSQNYETVIGLATLVLGVLIIRTILLKGYTLARAGALGMLVLAWSVVGAHLILILFSVGVLLAILYVRNLEAAKWAGKSAVIIVFATVIGAMFYGGMFALRAPESHILGAKSVTQDGKPLVELRWFRTVEAEFHAALKISYLIQMLRRDSSSEVVDSSEKIDTPALQNVSSSSANIHGTATIYTRTYALIQDLKQDDLVWGLIRILRSIQLVFLSLIAFILGYWYIRTKQAGAENWFLELYIIAAPLFFIGWLLSSVVFIYGQYGEVSRFFAPGVTLSLFLLGIVLAELIKRKNKVVKWAAFAVVLVSVIPVVFDYFVVGITGNFILPSVDHMRYEALGVGAPIERDDVLSIEERFSLLISPAVSRGENSFVQ